MVCKSFQEDDEEPEENQEEIEKDLEQKDEEAEGDSEEGNPLRFGNFPVLNKSILKSKINFTKSIRKPRGENLPRISINPC